jgi:hypothetical protein
MGLLALADEHRPVPVNQPTHFSPGTSRAVMILHDPGNRSAALVSIFNTFARGCSENTNAPCAIPAP